MGTRRWVVELESWLQRSGLSRDELAKRSDHGAAQVLGLFGQPDPNPTLQVYLELVQKAGARFNGVLTNDAAEVIRRLKEIMVRENIASVTALARVADVNRSQLSRMFNDPDPNPTLAVFDRLVVALGAEQDFVLVNYVDEAVAQVVALGTMEVQAVREAAARHLHAVPHPSPPQAAGGWERRLADAEAERAAATAREREVQAKMDAVMERAFRLHQANVDLEQRHADDAAEIVRLHGANAALERLRAEDAAEIARLTQDNRQLVQMHTEDAARIARLTAAKEWSLGKKIMLGLTCALTGAGTVGLVMRARR